MDKKVEKEGTSCSAQRARDPPNCLGQRELHRGSTELGKTFSSIDDSALLALGLMAEVAKGEESKWWPYIRTCLTHPRYSISILPLYKSKT